MAGGREGALSEREMSLLTAAADGLLPGGEGFPSASAAGAPAYMAAELGSEGVDLWLRPGVAGLDTLAGGDFLALDREGRTQALQRCQDEDGAFFDRLLNLAYYSYYAQPAVIDVIRAMGFVYNDAPQPQGYTMEPFDATNPEMLPARPRGYFKKTLEMHREVPQ
jgi:hypothetical protein